MEFIHASVIRVSLRNYLECEYFRPLHAKTNDLGRTALRGEADCWSYCCGHPPFSLIPCLTSLCLPPTRNKVGANSNDEKAEAAVRLSQANNPGLDVAFRRGGEAMEGSGAPPDVPAGVPTQGLPAGSD